MSKKALLVILDGWGIGKHDHSNAIYSTPTPYWSSLLQNYPNSQLQASGEDVGLPDGQMGNSEVGHLNIGAGKIVYQDLVKINIACRDNSILRNPEIVNAYTYAKQNGKSVHLMGLVSDGGVHSSIDHLLKLCDISREYGIDNTFVHCFMDGRDTDPRSGKGFIEKVYAHHNAKIASVIGRYYAMDRDNRWERVKEAYDLLTEGKGEAFKCAVEGVQASYDKDITDEFIKPIAIVDDNNQPIGTIKEGDVVIFFNYRNDRAKEITAALTQKDMPENGMHTLPLYYCTMTPYDAKFTGLHILFDKDNVQNTLGETISKASKKQLHIAETEKYAHVTFFFNGGQETPYEGEDRILVPSPKVATYDLKPEMSAYEVKDKLVEAINSQKYDFIVVNYANGDMVGHTGIYPAIEKAVLAIDTCVKDTIEAAKQNGYEAIIIADHGNADNAVNTDGSPNTAHSLNPVPFVYVTENKNAKVSNGILADVAPSILGILGIAQPAEMSGKNLIATR